ncbi:VanZ family protein [Exiguobacterium qingdaonense]|uniref:VanZ family protein n=1 Tax=Exiguobacterium qingdaonense TaxID=2751251 RepID=UPI001BE87E1F|nr:VanZ family protein [Exiguobacterium qingdaonense]
MRLLKNEFIWIALILIGLFFSSATPYSDQSIVSPLERFNWSWAEPTLANVQFDYAGKEISLDALGTAGLIEFFMRKAAHVVTFLVLGALFVKAISRTNIHAGLNLLFAWSLANTVAIFDEYHQSVTPERTALLQDVLLDSVGAAVGVVLVGGFILWRLRRKHAKKSGYVALR